MKPETTVKVLVRHAKSENNKRREDPSTDRIGGYQPKVKLAQPEGPMQARRFGEIAIPQLEEILDEEIEIVRLSAGPAERAQETARLAAEEMGLQLEIVTDPRLAELSKGNRWLGGHENRLRRSVEKPRYRERKEERGWDFRHGTRISGGQTPREAGTRVLEWINEEPQNQSVDPTKRRIDMAFGHGMSGRYGVGLAVEERDIKIVDRKYKMKNASAVVLTRRESGAWEVKGRILLPT